MQEVLLNEFDIDVSIATISRRLKKVRYTRKRGERVHPSRNKESRDA